MAGVSDSRTVYEARINKVIDHIDGHLDDRLLLRDLADVARFSPFHFHRIFRAWVGESPRDYVNRLRLEKAISLMRTQLKITLSAIALDCGFSSISDFSKSFKLAYGFSPKQFSPERLAEESKIRQDLATNLYENLSVTGGAQTSEDGFHVQIQFQPEMSVGYVRVMGGFQPAKLIGGLRKIMDWGRKREIWPKHRLIGRSRDNVETTPAHKYRYDWCVELPQGFKRDREVSFATIGSQKVACLHCEGDISKVGRAWSHLYRNWLPESGYQPADEAAMEIFYGEHELTPDAHFNLDCCLPIEPLQS